MGKLINIGILVCLLVSIFASSCKKDDTPDAVINVFGFKTPVLRVGIVDQASKTSTLTVPYGTNLKSITVSAAVPSGVTVTPSLSTPIDFSSKSVVFTVSNGSTSVNYTVNVVVGPNPLKVILIGEAATFDQLNMEMQKAYKWALSSYGEKAKYIPFSKITDEDLAAAKVIWWHQDASPKAIPAIAKDASVLDKLTKFYKAGGNFFLTDQAADYLAYLGRITPDYPTFGGGNAVATQRADNWGISFTNINFTDPDNAKHPIFSGLSLTDGTFDGQTYQVAYLVDPGMKKDNGAFFEFGKYQILTSAVPQPIAPNALRDKFQELTSSTVRASFEWDPAKGGVEFGIIVEFNPTTDYKGKSLTIGNGAFEWDQQDGRTNKFRPNIEKISGNSLVYLGL